MTAPTPDPHATRTPALGAAPLRTILVPTGFSELSRHAARYARTIAPAFGARVVVFHVVEPAPPPTEAAGMVPTSTGGPDVSLLMTTAREGLQRFIAENLPGAKSEPLVSIGVPDAEIVQAAQREGADLIVMGTHARGMLNRLVFGSISKSVLESAPCPVLLVPVRSEEAPGGRG